MIYVVSEFSYDNYHENYDRIYQTSVFDELVTTAHLGYMLKSRLPEIKNLVRVDTYFGGDRKPCLKDVGTDNIVEFENILFADSGFFDMFSVKLIAGDLSKALRNPYTIVLTQSSAKKLFGRTNVINKSVELVSGKGKMRSNYTITAIIEDVPGNSSLQYSGLVSFSTLNIVKLGGIEADLDHYNWGYATYLTVIENSDINVFEKKSERYFCKVYMRKSKCRP